MCGGISRLVDIECKYLSVVWSIFQREVIGEHGTWTL